MARHDTIYTVFLSGPADVSADLELIKQTISDVNLITSQLGFRLETFHWSTDATSGLSSDDAQARVNEQADHFDIIIVAFGARLGTPTIKYPSGTAEELSLAVEKVNSLTFGNDSIVLLFKNVKLDTMTGDLAEAARLQDFRKALPKNILYKQYEEDFDLREAILKTLGRIVKQIVDGKSQRQAATPYTEATTTELVQLEDEGDLGLLDLIELANDGFETATAHMEAISETITELGTFMNGITPKLGAAGEMKDRSLATSLIADVSQKMIEGAEVVSTLVPLMQHSIEQGLSSLEGAIEIQVSDFDDKNDLADREDLSSLGFSLAESALEARASIANFSVVLSTLPRMTKEFNKAKRVLLSATDQLIAAYDKTITRAREIGSRGLLM